MIRTVYILSAKRTPFGSFMGSLATLSAPKLGAIAIGSAIQDSGIKPEHVEQVYMGNVLSANVGQAPARQAAIFAGLAKSTPCTTINKVCGSGMKAVMLAAQSIETGEAECVVAGGMENMSQVPFYMENARGGFRMGHQKMIDGMIKDGLWDVYKDFHMGSAAELCAREMKFTREAQDQFAIESFKRAQEATKSGKFKNEIAVVEIAGRKGDVVKVDMFKEGDTVKVTGVSKGKGFQGVVKRHGFGGGVRTHGQSDRERAPGSIGGSSYPSRVFKGQRMAGRMGGDTVSVRNLKVIKVFGDSNLILVQGAVPGAKTGLVEIYKK